MDILLWIALALGTGVMLLIMLLERRWIDIGIGKVILFSVLLTLCGFASVKLMYFIENGEWGGQSFFGAIFLVPLWLVLLSYPLKEPARKLWDLSAPAICGMLAIMKIECLRSGCCNGRLLYIYYADNALRGVYFPSQIVELANAILLLILLLLMIRRKYREGQIYPLFMILYGATRFVWNLFRQTKPVIWILPAGNLWALASLLIGIGWLYYLRRGKQTVKNETK